MTPQAKTRPPSEVVAGEHDTALNIEQRLLNVMAELSYIQRDRQAPKEIGGFSFVSHDAVTAAVRPMMVKHGIYACSSVVQHERDGNQTTLIVETTFFNVDQPEDQRVVRSVGYGIDKQDKGPGKAMSYAVKYALLKALMLETGDDVEAEAVERDPHGLDQAAPAGASNGAHHTPGRPALAKFWAVSRGQKVPEEVIRMWFSRNLGLESTKDASDEQLAQAAQWAQSFMGHAKRLNDAATVMNMDSRTVVEEAGRMFDGVTGLGHLTSPEWEQLIGWAEAKANTALDQKVAAEDDDRPF
jgi:hypothetical protein